MAIQIPTGPTLDAIERLGRIMNAVGIPILLVLAICVLLGWVPSPLLTTTIKTHALLQHHDARVEQLVIQRTTETTELGRILNRLTDVLKMIDCGDIQDRTLRERCISR